VRSHAAAGSRGAEHDATGRPSADALVGRFELVAVNGQSLASYSYARNGWTVRFASGVVTIGPDETFVDVTNYQAHREAGDAAESSGSVSSASGRVSIVADSVVFQPADGSGRYAMRWSTAGDTVRLVQQFGPRVLTYERRPAARVAAASGARPAPSRRPAPGPDAPSAAAGGSERLRDVVRWAAPDASGFRDGYVVALPPALDSAIRAALPTFRVRAREEMVNVSTGDDPRVTLSAVVMDLDGDRLPEAVLLGTLADADSLDVVLGVRQTARGFEVRELYRGDAPLMPTGDGSSGIDTNVLAAERLTARGTFPTVPADGTTWWVRYQNVDCKGEGWQWTVRAGRWVRTPSPCSYGD
jgi:hypothetical protein